MSDNGLWDEHAQWWIDGFTNGADPEYVEQIIPLAVEELAGRVKVLDLGCGDARSLIIAAREFEAKGVGIERSPYCYLKSKLNVFLSGQKNIRILFGDFQKYEREIMKADVVYVYLLNSALKKIEVWIFASLKNNAKIVSLCFEFPNHKPKRIMETTNLGRKTKLRLY